MLDQNTDSMWFVIGAVIVGAAIIMILNGTMPQIFASVADTFREKTQHVTEVTDGIGPVTRTNLFNSGLHMRNTIPNELITYEYNDDGGFSVVSKAPSRERIKIRLQNTIPSNGRYEMTYDVKSSVANTAVEVDISDLTDVLSGDDMTILTSTEWQSFHTEVIHDISFEKEGTTTTMDFVDFNFMIPAGATIDVTNIELYRVGGV